MKQNRLALFILSFVWIAPILAMEGDRSKADSVENRFDNLPDEVIMPIISFLTRLETSQEQAEDLLNLKLVSRRFDVLINNNVLQENLYNSIEKYVIKNFVQVARIIKKVLESSKTDEQINLLNILRHVFSRKEIIEKVLFLIEHGAKSWIYELENSKFKDQQGWIALMRLCSSSNHKAVQSRLNSGADTNNWNGKAMLSLIREQTLNRGSDKLILRIGNTSFEITNRILYAFYLIAITGLILNWLPLYE